MKLLRMLDGDETVLVSEVKNQLILKELVFSQYSVRELAGRVRMPEVTLWKHLQKLLAAGLVEVSEVKKVGNLEKKLYRAAAANFIPAQFTNPRPKDPRLLEAFETYSQIQQMIMAVQAHNSEIPEGVNPVDYAFYMGLKAFVEVNKDPEFHRRVAELETELSEYGEPVSTPT